jgi:ketosteroid isomerase-like protein
MAKAAAQAGNPIEVVCEMYDAFNRRDVEGFLSHLAPDIHWYTLDLTIKPCYLRGRCEVGGFLRSLLASAAVFTAEPQELHCENELVLARICHRSRRRVSDPESAYQVVHLWTVRRGTVVKHRFYLAMSKASKALNGQRVGASGLESPPRSRGTGAANQP